MLSGNIFGKIIESYDVRGYVDFDKYEGDYRDDGVMHFHFELGNHFLRNI